MDYTTVSINLYPPRLHEVLLQGQKVANSSVMSQSLANLVTNVRNRVTGNCQAGQRWLSSSILMYLAEYMSTVGDFGGNVQIIPFDQSDVSNMGPIIDFVISKGSTYDGGAFYSQVILKDRLTLTTSENLWVWPRVICTNKDDMAQHHFCAIFQSSDASLDNLEVDLPYASILAPFCRRSVGFKALRGCVTNGEDWRFFLFVQNDSEEKGRCLILDKTLKLGDDLTGLPLLMGLLHDWVENCRNEDLRYCRLFQFLINWKKEEKKKETEIAPAQLDDNANKEEPQTGKLKKTRRKMSRGRHSNKGSNSQIRINGQSTVEDEAEGSSHNNDGAEIPAESRQKEKKLKRSHRSLEDDMGEAHNNPKEIISPQDDVSNTEKRGQQANSILPRPKRKRRKAKKKQVSTNNVTQINGQSEMVKEGSVLNNDLDGSEGATESYSKILGSSRKRARYNVGAVDD